MGNYFCHLENPDAEGFSVSNGGTSVFIAVLCLAGHEIATEDWQKDLLAWISTHDRHVIGNGNTGFDVSEMGWFVDRHDEQKRFLLLLTARARLKTNWQKLPYDPPLERAVYALEKFDGLVNGFKRDHCRNTGLDWTIEPNRPLHRCSVHDIFIHSEGCVICNDEL